jgi:hypothetical protein
LSPELRWRTEVPLPLAADRRAWDAAIRGSGWSLFVEAETVLADMQALERRIELKRRDGSVGQMILLVADTPHNRRALLAAPAAFAGFSRGARPVLRALRQARDPGTSAILML